MAATWVSIGEFRNSKMGVSPCKKKRRLIIFFPLKCHWFVSDYPGSRDGRLGGKLNQVVVKRNNAERPMVFFIEVQNISTASSSPLIPRAFSITGIRSGRKQGVEVVVGILKKHEENHEFVARNLSLATMKYIL